MTDDPRIPFPMLPPSGPERCRLVGEHPEMLKVFRLISVAAPTLASVLIIGAPGTGRTAVAKCIHRQSELSNGPWNVVHLGALTPKAAEDELFGEEHESGRGAIASRTGQLEQSRGGTLFLEDISSLPMALQARLFAALHAPRLERRRHADARSTEFRIIASAPSDLRIALAAGEFREDLYFRLAVVTIPLPTLSERGGDLLLLLAHFVGIGSRRAASGTPVLSGIATSALRSLEAHPWGTNVSELQALVALVVKGASSDTLQFADLPPEFRHEPTSASGAAKTHASLADVEAQHIAFVLGETNGMIHRAAEILGVHRNTLTRKIREYNIRSHSDR